MNLQNKIAVLTGVSGGIGKSLAEKLLAQGTKVYGLGRNNTLEHDNYVFIKTDVREQAQVDTAFDQILRESDGAVHILVNNAGLGYFGYLEDRNQIFINVQLRIPSDAPSGNKSSIIIAEAFSL